MKKSFKKSCNFFRGTFPIAIVLFSLLLLVLPAYTQEGIQDESQFLKATFAQVNTEGSSANPSSETSADGKSYKKKSAGLAWFLSFLIPGVGQYYIGEIGLGTAFLLIHLVAFAMPIAGIFVAVKSPIAGLALYAIGIPLLVANWLASWIMAPIRANKRNKLVQHRRGTDNGRNSFGHLLEGGGEKLVWGFDISPNFQKSIALDSDKKAEGLPLNGFSLNLSLHY